MKRFKVLQPDGTEILSRNPEGVRFTTVHQGKLHVLYDPNPKQLELHGMSAPNVLAYGGRGSGKSLALRMEAHMRAMNTPGMVYCILRRTYPELQKSHLLFVNREMELLGGTYNKTDKMVYYPNGSIGLFAHCETEADTSKVLSAEFAWMGFDEVSTFEWEMFLKLAASTRAVEDKNLIAMVRCCTNPLGASAEEINRHFLLKDIQPEEDPEYNPADWEAIQINIEHNPALNKDQYLKRFAGMSANVKKAWIEGEFSFENALFDFDPKRSVIIDGVEKVIPYHVTDYIDLPAMLEAGKVYRAFDMGWFPDPAYCLWILHLGNRYICFHEKKWFKTIAVDIARDMKEITEELGVKRVITTYCDPSIALHDGLDRRTIKDMFEAEGVPMDCSINDRMEFARSVHMALGEEAQQNIPRLQIYKHGDRGCPYLVKAIPQMKFDPKHIEKMDDHKHDHPVVALAYFLMSRSSDKMISHEEKKVPKWMKTKAERQYYLGQQNIREGWKKVN